MIATWQVGVNRLVIWPDLPFGLLRVKIREEKQPRHWSTGFYLFEWTAWLFLKMAASWCSPVVTWTGRKLVIRDNVSASRLVGLFIFHIHRLKIARSRDLAGRIGTNPWPVAGRILLKKIRAPLPDMVDGHHQPTTRKTFHLTWAVSFIFERRRRNQSAAASGLTKLKQQESVH